ncbi:Ubiquitin carboxyl-terminal hydrolase 12, partial [Mucuna pruriens]
MARRQAIFLGDSEFQQLIHIFKLVYVGDSNGGEMTRSYFSTLLACLPAVGTLGLGKVSGPGGVDLLLRILKCPLNMLAMVVGVRQKEIVNKIVEKSSVWSSRAIHVSTINQTKWWFAKRFLHPDAIAEYNYIFLLDEDLLVDNFDPKSLLNRVLVRDVGDLRLNNLSGGMQMCKMKRLKEKYGPCVKMMKIGKNVLAKKDTKKFDVKGCKDVYASFDKYMEMVWIEGEKKYHVEHYGLQKFRVPKEFAFHNNCQWKDDIGAPVMARR